MNRGIARQGFALITAVVISAAILATIVGIATLTVRETRVQAEQNASDQALAVAERGLADVVSQLRTNQTLANQVIALPDSVHWEPTPSSGTMSPGGHAFYWVKVVPRGTSNPNHNYEIYAAGFIAGENISGKTSDQLKDLAADSTKVLARRVVQVTGTMSSSGPSAFDYGMFTGTSFSMVGSKDLANVTAAGTLGIYATQDITMTSNHTLSNLQLYAEHAIDASGVSVVAVPPTTPPPTLASISHPNWPSTATFPPLDLEKYMDLFDAFVAGKAPFGGPVMDSLGVQTNVGYPDLSNATVRNAVLTALGNPQNNNVTVGGQVHHFVIQDNQNWLSNYTAKVVALDTVTDTPPGTLPGTLPSLTLNQRIALKSTLSKSVFYVRTSATNENVKWQSDREYLAGVIVCSGTVDFTGCPDFADGQVAAILARGDIDIAGSTVGDTASRGIFYSEGEVKYTGSGWFDGQLISQDTIRFTGSGDVTFEKYSSMFGNLLPGGDTTTVVNGFSQNPSGWTEKAWADFQAVLVPAS